VQGPGRKPPGGGPRSLPEGGRAQSLETYMGRFKEGPRPRRDPGTHVVREGAPEAPPPKITLLGEIKPLRIR